jgi:hypothetical protein
MKRGGRTVDRCWICKRIRATIAFPLDRRACTCSACHVRRRDLCREQKGKPVSQERRTRRFARAQWVVEKALRVRIWEEGEWKRWLDTRELWEQGELTEGWGVTRAERESFPKGEEYREDWRDLADDGESSTGSEESCEDLANEGENPQEDWGSSTDVEESSTNLQGARRVLRV